VRRDEANDKKLPVHLSFSLSLGTTEEIGKPYEYINKKFAHTIEIVGQQLLCSFEEAGQWHSLPAVELQEDPIYGHTPQEFDGTAKTVLRGESVTSGGWALRDQRVSFVLDVYKPGSPDSVQRPHTGFRAWDDPDYETPEHNTYPPGDDWFYERYPPFDP